VPIWHGKYLQYTRARRYADYKGDKNTIRIKIVSFERGTGEAEKSSWCGSFLPKMKVRPKRHKVHEFVKSMEKPNWIEIIHLPVDSTY